MHGLLARPSRFRRLLATASIIPLLLVASCAGEAVLPEWNFVVSLATRDGAVEGRKFTKVAVHVTVEYDSKVIFDDNVRYFPLKLYERQYGTKPMRIHASSEGSGHLLMCWFIDVGDLKKVGTDGPGSVVDCTHK